MTEEFVCTLSPDDAPRRAAQARRLVEGLRAHDHAGRMARFRFAPAVLAEVHQFVADESACCSFFTFGVDERADEIELTLTAPEGAEHMLDALVSVFADESVDPAAGGTPT